MKANAFASLFIIVTAVAYAANDRDTRQGPTEAVKQYLKVIQTDDRQEILACFAADDSGRALAQAFVDLVLEYRHLSHVIELRFKVDDQHLPYLLRPFSDYALQQLAASLRPENVTVDDNNATVSIDPVEAGRAFHLVVVGNRWALSPSAILNMQADASDSAVHKAVLEQRRYGAVARQVADAIEHNEISQLDVAVSELQKLAMQIVSSEIPATQATTSSSNKNVLPSIVYGNTDVICFSSGVDSVAAIFGNGDVGFWSIFSGRRINHFTLNHKPVTPRGILVSGGPTPKLAMLYAEAPDPKSYFLSLWDCDAGKLIWEKDAFASDIAAIIGFTIDNHYLMCQTVQGKVIALDTDSGKLTWTISFVDLFDPRWPHLKSVQVSDDGQFCCIVFGGLAVCRNAAGQEMWRRKVPDDPTYPILLGTTDNVRIVNKSEGAVKLLSFTAGNGQGSVAFGDSTVITMATNVSSIVANKSGKTLLISDGTSNPILLEGIDETWTISFSQDGKHLLCLPGFKKSPPPQVQGGVIQLNRTSNTLEIFNVEKGSRERKISLVPDDAGK